MIAAYYSTAQPSSPPFGDNIGSLRRLHLILLAIAFRLPGGVKHGRAFDLCLRKVYLPVTYSATKAHFLEWNR
jgi:hypothetical protein